MKQLYSIPEFAEAAGKKKQGIYEQAKNENSKLFPYVVSQGTKTFIKGEALKEVYGIEQDQSPNSQERQDISKESKEQSQASQAQSQEINQDSQTENQEESQENQAKSQEESQAPRGQEQSIISFLQDQIREKDRQLAEKDKQIEKIQQLLDQEQQLHARTNLLLAEYREKAEATQEDNSPAPTETGEKQDINKEPQKKRSWLYRLFFEG